MSTPKLELYKTAFSPLYNCYVTIESVHRDNGGIPVLICSIKGSRIIFRSYELERYSL